MSQKSSERDRSSSESMEESVIVESTHKVINSAQSDVRGIFEDEKVAVVSNEFSLEANEAFRSGNDAKLDDPDLFSKKVLINK